MPYPLLSSLHLPILICINYYYHLKNLGLTSLSYYHSVTVNVLLNHALSPCLSGSLLSDVHHIICYSIMHCSAVYLDPFYSSRIFCNASSPIFFFTMHSCHIQSPLYYSPGVSCHWKKYIFLFYFILFYFTMTTAEVPLSLSILYRKLWLSQSSFLLFCVKLKKYVCCGAALHKRSDENWRHLPVTIWKYLLQVSDRVKTGVRHNVC